MKKRWRIMLFCVVLAVLSVPGVMAAHSHPGDPITNPTTSPWAQNEINTASEIGLIPDGFTLDYRAPMTRFDFCRAALNFVAVQNNLDPAILVGMLKKHCIHTDETGSMVQVFKDCGDDPYVTDQINAAHYLGIIKGRGDSIFDPNGLITREEAAVMLTRAYEALGVDLPDLDAAKAFSDQNLISSWAENSVATLKNWDVMKGMTDDLFGPKQTYTTEQCIATFLRLYENAPVSRSQNNVPALFTYDQGIEYLESITEASQYDRVGYHQTLRIDGPVATMIRMDWSGSLNGTSILYFVYRDGGLRAFDPGLCLRLNTLTPDLKLETPHFSQDGNTFFCEITLTEDTLSYPTEEKTVLHKMGLYHISVDLKTCTSTQTYDD